MYESETDICDNKVSLLYNSLHTTKGYDNI